MEARNMNQTEYLQEYPKDNREHKSSVFCKVFSEKKDLLDLYNALNGTNYDNEDDLEINTIENVIYMTMKNDISFIVDCTLNLYEHQSTYNPNMPLRGFLYFSKLYHRYVEQNGLDLFSSVIQEIPLPQYVVFYNGTQEQPDKTILKLSDAFSNKSYRGCLECEANMLNINYGHNRELMEKCQKLKEYALFVDTVREYMHKSPKTPRKAFTKAVENCINNNILRDFLVNQKSEVLETMLTTFNKELYEKNLREQATAEGLAEGKKAHLLEQIQKKLNKNQTIEQIAEALEESPEVIQQYIEELKNK